MQAEQSTSGTLAYAVGAGKAVISTPYGYARELLADGRGVLVPWRDADAIAMEVISLSTDTERREQMCARAKAHGVRMTWAAVGRQHTESLMKACASYATRRRRSLPPATLASRPITLPDVNLSHVRAMTDDTGILQHAAFSIPRYGDGYCVDDNARALLLSSALARAGETQLLSDIDTSRFAAFVQSEAGKGIMRRYGYR